MSRTDYRFTLVKYSGKSSRCTCPNCGRPRRFTRYLDTHTNQQLPEEYGICDRADQCGYRLSPYEKGRFGQSYADQLKEDRPSSSHCQQYRKPTPAPPAIVSPPDVVFKATLGHYEHNSLARLLREHFGWTVADELLSRFQIGTSVHQPGSCVFWYIDEAARVRGGKIMLYDETFHRIKEGLGRPDWMHTVLPAICRRQSKPVPGWLSAYAAPSNEKSPCLFGLPQLVASSGNQPIAIVESEKTAILATPYMPGFLWMATGSLVNLTEARLSPIKSRRIVLWPDASVNGRAYQLWADKAAELRGRGYDITVSNHLEKTLTEQQKAAGYDLADLILNDWPGYPPSWDNTSL
ncbi:hypothetical protein CDA63_09015 [Hymenobacter amundsenii]|uniref:Toprim domain-containing protein n=1 Tax=Hymenobacter amundsenii TaxID=2006685 RepID=A0A246FL79_9BACT|nr:DUF6371 domain-containing protein [Hymenobacter amundsenii]OWP63506.1 hypothetical protein CDA63_09015 [Hymenobacter amundsenii]